MTGGVSASPNGSQETRRDHWDEHRHDGLTRLRNISDNEVCHVGRKSPGVPRHGGVVVSAEEIPSRKALKVSKLASEYRYGISLQVS
ncbi:hypothetical protein Y032_0191g1292 [Ancylostoma ceylanicum]|uniref:Uncharacterized protein n=1 Tax=Ancylostoma ceylanicum TaxID=53326 RepID=A0A016SPX5_9BILA|nr:hypothetical protein Y032_0191g1292 [Ancylostoma ceylanicum]